jgi:hypothetical protein
MLEEVQKSDLLCRVNWPGIIAGLFTIALPFLGMWWQFELGTGAVVMALSPFGVESRIFGESVSSPLFLWITLGLKLAVVYLGVLLLTGSVLSVSTSHTATAELFVRFSARKLSWLVVAFVAGLLIFVVLANRLPEMVGLPFQLELPYLIGTSTLSAGVEGMHITIPIVMSFTQAFGIAVVAAALGIVALLYQKKDFYKLNGYVNSEQSEGSRMK